MRLREGKNPDRRLSVPKYGLSGEEKDVNSLRQLGGWLRSSHSFKECVIAHQSSGFAPKMVGTEVYRRSHGLLISSEIGDGRRASQVQRRYEGTRAGALASEDAGMSTR